MNLDHYRVDGRKGDWKLEQHDSDDHAYCDDKETAGKRLARLKADLFELQNKLYAGNRYGLLLVLQAMDGGGKDGTIRNVMSGVNPQGCHVSSFKVPSVEEANHDFLWRIHDSSPARGRIVIFNRSHYEDVVIVRVHADRILPDWARERANLWEERYEQINNFERMLTQNNIVIVKCFLHISRDEQRQRMEKRLHDPAKNWKFSVNDLKEREYWDDYMSAYEQAFRHTSTEWAPWHVIPGNRKWYRNLVVAELIVARLKALGLTYPEVDPEILKGVVVK